MQTNRIQLRKIQDQDIENIFRGLSHPSVIKYYGVSFHSLEATKEQMDWYSMLEKERKGQWWAVCSLDGKTFLGAGGLNDRDHENRKAEIGFWLLPDYWGQGYMTEAMPLICEYAFHEMDINRIEGFVESNNKNCKRAMAKLNFTFEGTMRNCEYKDGAFISLDIYSKLKTD